MACFRIDLRGGAFRSVLGFTLEHWRHQPGRMTGIMAAVLLSTLADVLTPLYSGRLVDAVANGAASDIANWNAAVAAFSTLIALRPAPSCSGMSRFIAIIDLTLKMMGDIAPTRSTACSGSRPTGMPTALPVRPCARSRAACGRSTCSTTRCWSRCSRPSSCWSARPCCSAGTGPLMGLIVGVGSMIYIGVTVALSVSCVAPAASLANAWDTRLGGALADAI